MTQLQSTMASLPLIFGYRAVFEAIDPTDGSTVSGVEIINPSIYGIDLTGGEDDNAANPILLTPSWIPFASDELEPEPAT